MNDELVRQLVQRARSGVPNDRIVTVDEAAEWPKGAFDALLREGFLQEIQPAMTVECDACFEGHAEVVEFVEEPPGSGLRAYIVCPESGRVKVDPQRMRRWEIVANEPEASTTGKSDAVRRPIRGSPQRTHPRFLHSPDFRSVNLDGHEHSLTGRQAQVVEFLYEMHQNKTPEVSQSLLLEHIESKYTELRYVFKDNPAWGTLVVPGRTKGTVRLSL
jgi:hypothetical protein